MTLAVVTAKVSYLAPKIAPVRNKLKLLSTIHTEAGADLAENLVETRENLGRKRRECDAIEGKAGKL